MEATTTSSNPMDEFKGLKFLFALMCGCFGIIFMAIIVKRMIHRFSFRYIVRSHLPGHRAPENLEKLVKEKLADVANLTFEPSLLLQPGDPRLKKLKENKVDPSDNYLYRLRTIDMFKDIDRCLTKIDSKLKRPSNRDMLEHLLAVKSHSSSCLNFLHTSDVKTLANIYNAARYSPRPFGPKEFNKFEKIYDAIIPCLKNPVDSRKKTKTHQRRVNTLTTDIEDDSLHSTPVISYHQ